MNNCKTIQIRIGKNKLALLKYILKTKYNCTINGYIKKCLDEILKDNQ